MRQAPDQAYEIISKKSNTKARSLTTIVIKKLITPVTIPNPEDIQKTNSSFNNLHVND